MPISNCPFLNIGDGVLRPYLLTKIINPLNKKFILSFGLVDTGADDCSVPAIIAKNLGHDLQAGRQNEIGTGNGVTIAYSHTAKIEILHPLSKQTVYIIPDTPVDFMPNLPIVLLGVQNFLSRFVLTIDYPQKNFSIHLP